MRGGALGICGIPRCNAHAVACAGGEAPNRLYAGQPVKVGWLPTGYKSPTMTAVFFLKAAVNLR